MKKLIFILFISTLLYGQEINVKKEVINLDDVPVAKIKREKRVYKVSTLDDKLKFTIEYNDKTEKGNIGEKGWYVIKNEDGTKSNELSYKILSLSPEKSILKRIILEEPKLIDKNGVNDSVLLDFFNNPTLISYNIDKKIDDIIKMQSKADSLATSINLQIKDDNFIYLDDKIIGKSILETITQNQNTNHKYNLYDLDFNLIASYNYRENIIKIEDKKFDIIEPDVNKHFSNNEVAKRVLNNIYYNGFRLENQKNNALAERYAEINKDIGNIDKVDGYIIDEKGNKINGKIKINYADLTSAINPNTGMSNLSAFGTTVSVFYKNEKGRDKINNYNAKDEVTFCIIENSEEVCFKGFKPIGDNYAISKVSLDTSSLITKTRFFKVIFSKDDNYILSYPTNPEYFYLKLKGKNEALFMPPQNTDDNKVIEKRINIFNEYTNCSSINYNDYQFDNKDSLIKLIEDYNAKCIK